MLTYECPDYRYAEYKQIVQALALIGMQRQVIEKLLGHKWTQSCYLQQTVIYKNQLTAENYEIIDRLR